LKENKRFQLFAKNPLDLSLTWS